MILWLDDLRKPDFDKECTWVKNYDDFVNYISNFGMPEKIWFDHDLGEDKTGYDCAKWLVAYCFKYKMDIPEYAVQSANSVGRKNIIQILDTYHNRFLEGSLWGKDTN